jgi:hypothetical protein
LASSRRKSSGVWADPAYYLSYYYSHGNLNPRLPPPVLSKEDWRSTQRLKSGVVGGIGDKRRPVQNDAGQGTGTAVGRSLFSQHPGFEREEEARNDGGGAAEWVDGGGDGLIGFITRAAASLCRYTAGLILFGFQSMLSSFMLNFNSKEGLVLIAST